MGLEQQSNDLGGDQTRGANQGDVDRPKVSPDRNLHTTDSSKVDAVLIAGTRGRSGVANTTIYCRIGNNPCLPVEGDVTTVCHFGAREPRLLAELTEAI